MDQGTWKGGASPDRQQMTWKKLAPRREDRIWADSIRGTGDTVSGENKTGRVRELV